MRAQLTPVYYPVLPLSPRQLWTLQDPEEGDTARAIYAAVLMTLPAQPASIVEGGLECESAVWGLRALMRYRLDFSEGCGGRVSAVVTTWDRFRLEPREGSAPKESRRQRLAKARSAPLFGIPLAGFIICAGGGKGAV